MTLLELYRSYNADGMKFDPKTGEILLLQVLDIHFGKVLLEQTHWFTVNSVFDPKTGEALPQSLSAFLSNITRPKAPKPVRDRLWRITDHARNSVERLFRALNESPRREQAFLPVRAVRELDANSFIKLSNRPGRTIREKLAKKPYLHAVRRFQSIDLPENRLLKAFVSRLAELLELRQDYLGEEEDELLSKIRSWLLSSEAQSIARWENLPPNNALLSHRDYRRVWDAWRRLQTLDDDIDRDFSQFETRKRTMEYWCEYGQKYTDGKHLFANMPVCFNYEEFEIRPWKEPPLFQQKKEKIIHYPKPAKIAEPVCVDFTGLHPRYFSQGQKGNKAKSETLHESFIWQRWKNESESVDINLFNSDALFLHPDAATISSSDLLFSKDIHDEYLDHAASAFVSRLYEFFTNDRIIWLVPDFLNDFELNITRRNINARFPNAEPLPRSIAAVFAQVDYSKIKDENFSVIVIDNVGGKTCVIKLCARFDPLLKERIPETCGFYWERCPPILIPAEDSEEIEIKNYDIITVDETGRWRDKPQPKPPQSFDVHALRKDERIGQFAFFIDLAGSTESPVAGGMRFHVLQQNAGDIPLWRDHIPELSIKVMKDGCYQPYWLVSRDTTIAPIRGRPVPINIQDHFTLPAGRQFYQFPLFQGENTATIGFSARIESPSFPLKANTACRLNMTFTYGADDPYCLIFAPLKNEFPPVMAKWQKVGEEIITDAPAPPYPTPLPWEALKHWKNAQGKEENLLDWLIDALTALNDKIPNRSQITISRWVSRNDKNDSLYWFAFAKTDIRECIVYPNNILDSFSEPPNIAFPAGTEFLANIQERENGKLAAYDISKTENTFSDETKSRLLSFRKKSLQNRMPLIWADNRSLKDAGTPVDFKKKFNELISLLSKRLPPEIFNRKFLILLSCLHKDTGSESVQWIMEQVDNEAYSGFYPNEKAFNLRAIGLALGDVSQPWQQYIVSKLLSQQTAEVLRIFSYAIWNEQHFVESFTLENLQSILDRLNKMLLGIKPCPKKRDEKDKWTVPDWIRTTAEPLELLLGLLRTRASEDSSIKMMLQPHQKITKELAKRVEEITGIIAQSRGIFPSRVKLENIQKPRDDHAPDLLYALRLYLTGDDSANAIHISGVSDDEKDYDN